MMPVWLWKTLVYIFYIILLVALGVGIYFLKLHYELSLWLSVFIFCSIVGSVLLIIYGRKYFFRRKEKDFIKRIINEDGRRIDSIKTDSSIAISELDKTWFAAINQLKQSNLKKLGNPLYVLPWYMVIGESGSGKTTMIQGSGLSSPLNAGGSIGGIGGTKNCEWWFFNEAIVIDTAGRYTIEVNRALDDSEWERFLQLLAKYRTREPINGLVITIGVDSLKNELAAQIYEKAQRIRKKIDQVMRTLGENFPIYVMVTKMDLVYGFVSFFSFLEKEDKKQAMGFLNDNYSLDCNELFNNGYDGLLNKIREDRFKLVHTYKTDIDTVAQALIFSSEFQKLKPLLGQFIHGLFEPNNYQETPIFRGMYFSASKAEDTIASAFSEISSIEKSISQPSKTFSPLFVSEFFAKIMPQDRYIYHPIIEYIKWKKVTLSGLAVSWVLICIALSSYLVYSYNENLKILDMHSKISELRTKFSDDLTNNIYILWETNKLIRTEHDLVQDESNRLFGRSYADEYVVYEKNIFAHEFDTYFLNILENRITNLIDKGIVGHNQEFLSDLAQFLVYEVYMLDNRFEKNKVRAIREDLNYKAVTGAVTEYVFGSLRDNESLALTVGQMFGNFVLRDTDQADLENHKKIAQLNLLKLLKYKDDDMTWLLGRTISNSDDIYLKNFWPTLSEEYSEIKIEGAYFASGRENIKSFLSNYKVAIAVNPEDAKWFSEKEKRFWALYNEKFLKQWHRFLMASSTAYKDIESFQDMQALTNTMSSIRNSPNITVLHMSANEFKKYSSENQKLPDWGNDLVFLDEVISYKPIQEVNKTTAETLLSEVKKLENFASPKHVNPVNIDRDGLLKSSQAFEKYYQSLTTLTQVGVSNSTAFTLASNFFKDSNDFQKSKAEFYVTYADYLALISTLESQIKMSQFIKDYLIEPFRFYTYYAVNEAACFLDSKWEEGVIGGIRGIPQAEVANILFDSQKGLVWSYFKNYASPFLIKNANGYQTKTALNQSIDFDSTFLGFMNKGSISSVTYQDSYSIKIKALPISANIGSKIEPYGVVLELACGGKSQKLSNYNYPSEETFNWSNQDCTDTTVKILLEDAELIKTYPGKNGFIKFLEDFKSGTKSFKATDFPGYEDLFNVNTIKNISVGYSIYNSEKMMKNYNETPNKVPSQAAECWTK